MLPSLLLRILCGERLEKGYQLLARGVGSIIVYRSCDFFHKTRK
jgi:hypothetical protein